MATGTTQIGYGTTLKWNAQPIAKLTKIGEMILELERVDVSTFDAASAYQVVKVGLIKAPEVTFEGVLDTTDTAGLMAAFADAASRTNRAWIITFPTSLGTCTWTGTGYISIGTGDITPEGFITIKGKIIASTVPAWSSAA
jgi:hypothetical protein